MPITPEEILSDVPQEAGSAVDGATAINFPVGESVLGDPSLNGEHLLGNIGLENLLDGHLHRGITRAILSTPEDSVAHNEAISHVEKLIKKSGGEIQSHMKSFHADERPPSEVEIKTPEEHNSFRTKFFEMTSDPQVLTDRLFGATEVLHALAPQTATSLQEAASRAVSFLSAKMQQPPPTPFGQEYSPSQTEVSQFHRYARIVDKPTLALKELKEGTVLPETTETLQTVYPKLYEHMKQTVLSELKPDTSYQKKIALSQFLGESMDETLTRPAVQSLQSVFQTAPQNSPSPKRSSKSSEAIDLADRTSLKPNLE